jgi:hypothetical protein
MLTKPDLIARCRQVAHDRNDVAPEAASFLAVSLSAWEKTDTLADPHGSRVLSAIGRLRVACGGERLPNAVEQHAWELMTF